MKNMKLTPLAAASAVVLLGASVANAADVILTGNVLKVGVNDGGSLIDSGFVVGIDHDPLFGGAFGVGDFLKPGTPYEFYSLGYAGATGGAGNFTTGGGDHTVVQYLTGNNQGGTTTDTSAGIVHSTVTTGVTFGALALTQAMDFTTGGGTIHFHVTLTNTSLVSLTDVVYGRGLDPDQDVYVGGGYPTDNTIVSQDLVTASAPVSGWTIGIASSSPYDHAASVRADWSANPNVLQTSQDDGDGDYSILMGWDIGDLAPGATARIDFEYRIANTADEVVHPTPDTGSTLGLLGLALTGLFGFKKRFAKRA